MGILRFFSGEASPPRIEKRVAELEERCESLERANKNMKLEWEESYDKLHHLMARVTKRAVQLRRDQERVETDSQTAPEASESNGGEPLRGNYLGTHGLLQEARRRHGLLPR